eukprot:CAMPEP_0178371018 /NCGR_PEP_ID=MMETSP0689_2-20121128/606_1 /TAXON_ID=160604 /ORGANISM="Amphidinium massartii, Strain CS-259" /LENGTH=1003 /DNA_ID=CAMNT_0019990867 /DNA_START=40 /DNA_END=3052 /DNA_ORIENTATION=-
MPPREASQMRSELLAKQKSTDKIWKALLSVRIQDADASVPEDRQRIFEIIQSSIGFHALNSIVSKCLQDWIVATCETELKRQLNEQKLSKQELGMLCCAVGSLFRTVGNSHRALQVLNIGLGLLESSKQLRTFEGGVLLVNLGATRRHAGDLSGAMEAFRQAESIYIEHNELESIDGAILMNSMGAVSRDTGNLAQAIRYLEVGVEILKKLDSLESNDGAMLLNTLGAARRADGKLQQAVKDLEEARRIYVATGTLETPGGALMLISIASAKRDLKQFKEVFQHLAQAQHILEKTGTLETKHGLMLFNSLSTAYRQVGDSRQAYAMQLKAKDCLRIIDDNEGRKRDNVDMPLKIAVLQFDLGELKAAEAGFSDVLLRVDQLESTEAKQDAAQALRFQALLGLTACDMRRTGNLEGALSLFRQFAVVNIRKDRSTMKLGAYGDLKKLYNDLQETEAVRKRCRQGEKPEKIFTEMLSDMEYRISGGVRHVSPQVPPSHPYPVQQYEGKQILCLVKVEETDDGSKHPRWQVSMRDPSGESSAWVPQALEGARWADVPADDWGQDEAQTGWAAPAPEPASAALAEAKDQQPEQQDVAAPPSMQAAEVPPASDLKPEEEQPKKQDPPPESAVLVDLAVSDRVNEVIQMLAGEPPVDHRKFTLFAIGPELEGGGVRLKNDTTLTGYPVHQAHHLELRRKQRGGKATNGWMKQIAEKVSSPSPSRGDASKLRQYLARPDVGEELDLFESFLYLWPGDAVVIFSTSASEAAFRASMLERSCEALSKHLLSWGGRNGRECNLVLIVDSEHRNRKRQDLPPEVQSASLLVVWDALPDSDVLVKLELMMWESSQSDRKQAMVIHFISNYLNVFVQNQTELRKLKSLSPDGWLEEAVTLESGQLLPAGSRCVDEPLSELKDLPTLMRFSTLRVQWGQASKLRRLGLGLPELNIGILRELAVAVGLGHLAERAAGKWLAAVWLSARKDQNGELEPASSSRPPAPPAPDDGDDDETL